MAQYVHEKQFWAGDDLHRRDRRLKELFVIVEGRVAVGGGEYGTGTVGSSEALARIDHRFGNEGDFGRPERFSESFAIDPVQVE